MNACLVWTTVTLIPHVITLLEVLCARVTMALKEITNLVMVSIAC